MKSCILIAMALWLLGCSNEGPKPITPWIPDSTIHLAGRATDKRGYWKNGVFSAINANVHSMSVDGLTVLIGGHGPEGAITWKNGRETIISPIRQGRTLVATRGDKVFGVWLAPKWVLYRDGTTTPLEPTGWPTAIALHGDDVYLSGSSKGMVHQWQVSPFYHLDTYAVCWKNEQEIFRETDNSYANTIFINGDDVYLGGHLNHYPSLDKIACYWKNGQRVTLTNEDQDAQVRSLFVTDTHVYAAGEINEQAVYWKDGVAIFLSSGNTTSKANSISVLGTDVYVAGQEDMHEAVWKNGVKQPFPQGVNQGEFMVVVAVSN